jgi:hypothetical protein
MTAFFSVSSILTSMAYLRSIFAYTAHERNSIAWENKSTCALFVIAFGEET